MNGKTAELIIFSHCIHTEKEEYYEPMIERPIDILQFLASYKERGFSNIDDIMGTTRKQEVVLDRHLTQALCRAFSLRFNKMWSLDRIGREIGDKNHSNVLYACKQIWSYIFTKDSRLGDISGILLLLGLNINNLKCE